MLRIEDEGGGRFRLTLTDRAHQALMAQTRTALSPEETAEYGELTMPAAEVLRAAIRDHIGLSQADAADAQAEDLNDGVPF